MSELWAVVEVMGHSQYAGKVSEYSELGVPLVRVEIPATPGGPACEKLLGAASIFRITPMTEEAAREIAGRLRVNPLALVGLPSVQPACIEHNDEDIDDGLDPDEWDGVG